jgi:Rrf2 family protein
MVTWVTEKAIFRRVNWGADKGEQKGLVAPIKGSPSMQLTRAADYAVRVMIHLAGLPAGTRVSRAELVQATDAPESFLAKVLQALARAEMISSRRGLDGGFELVAERETTTVLQVVEALEGPVQLNQCLTATGCGRMSWCAAHLVWAQAQEAMVQVLRGATIADLATTSAIRKAALQNHLAGNSCSQQN